MNDQNVCPLSSEIRIKFACDRTSLRIACQCIRRRMLKCADDNQRDSTQDVTSTQSLNRSIRLLDRNCCKMRAHSKIFFLLSLSCALTQKNAAAQTLACSSEPLNVYEGASEDLILNITGGSSQLASGFCEPLLASVQDRKIVDFAAPGNMIDSQRLDFRPDLNGYNVSLKGKFVGKSFISFVADEISSAGAGAGVIKSCPVHVLRVEGRIQIIFGVVIGVITIINTFIMGMQLDWRVIWKTLKRPIPLLIGIGVQYTFQPPIAFGWSQLLLADSVPYQLAYFAVGASPGGGSAMLWTILLNGNLDLSVTLSIVANVVALGLMPLWLFTLGRYITRDSNIAIPYVNILGSLAMVFVPVCLGLLLKHFKPRADEYARKIIKISSLIVIIVGGVLGIYSSYYVFLLLTGRIILCGLLLPWGGYLLGYAAAWMLRQTPADRISIALGTGIQKTGIAIILLLFSLDHPDSDLAVVMPVAVIMMVPLPLIVCLIVKSVVNCLRASKNAQQNDDTTVDGATAEPGAAGKAKKIRQALRRIFFVHHFDHQNAPHWTSTSKKPAPPLANGHANSNGNAMTLKDRERAETSGMEAISLS